jgi:hypothetical protein
MNNAEKKPIVGRYSTNNHFYRPEKFAVAAADVTAPQPVSLTMQNPWIFRFNEPALTVQ